jgi:hypothetical protein
MPHPDGQDVQGTLLNGARGLLIVELWSYIWGGLPDMRSRCHQLQEDAGSRSSSLSMVLMGWETTVPEEMGRYLVSPVSTSIVYVCIQPLPLTSTPPVATQLSLGSRSRVAIIVSCHSGVVLILVLFSRLGSLGTPEAGGASLIQHAHQDCYIF